MILLPELYSGDVLSGIALLLPLLQLGHRGDGAHVYPMPLFCHNQLTRLCGSDNLYLAAPDCCYQTHVDIIFTRALHFKVQPAAQLIMYLNIRKYAYK